MKYLETMVNIVCAVSQKQYYQLNTNELVVLADVII